ncbi:hypothetical protein AAY473_035868 [Plecturocebus cupreus]
MISAHCVSISQVQIEFHWDGQTGLELLTSSDPPASASQTADIVGVSHCAQPRLFLQLLEGRQLGGHGHREVLVEQVSELISKPI